MLYYASRRNVKVTCVLLCFLGVLRYLNKACVFFYAKYRYKKTINK